MCWHVSDVYSHFGMLDLADNDGRLTGNDAVKFFSLSQLPRAELKQVLRATASENFLLCILPVLALGMRSYGNVDELSRSRSH